MVGVKAGRRTSHAGARLSAHHYLKHAGPNTEYSSLVGASIPVGVAWLGLAWLGLIRFGLILSGLVRFWFCMAWFGSVQFGCGPPQAVYDRE